MHQSQRLTAAPSAPGVVPADLVLREHVVTCRRFSTARFGRVALLGLAVALWSCGDDPSKPDEDDGLNRIPSEIRNLEPNAFRFKVRADGGGYDVDGVESMRYRGVGVIFDLGLWIGANVGGAVRVSATSYNGSEFDAIELGEGERSKVYLLLPGDHAGIPDFDQWPMDHGAPKTPEGLPRLLGDATMFAVFDDTNPDLHEHLHSDPLDAEVRQTAWGFAQPDSVLFVHYEVRNISAQSWDEAYLGVWADVDLGAASNDRAGCDVPRQLGIMYTSPLEDEYETTFGGAQPALGIRLLATPNDAGFFAFPWIIKTATEPRDAAEAYRLLQGLNIDGEAFYDSTAQMTTRHVLSGDPITGTGWVEEYSSDKRFLLSTGPLSVAPGGSVSLTIGIVLARAAESLDALAAVREASDAMAEAGDRWDLF